jgi:hypothetical protein
MPTPNRARIPFPRLRRASLALVVLAFPTAALADEPAPASASAPAPLVMIDSTRPFTVIERRANEIRGWNMSFPPSYVRTEQWETACVAPCLAPLDPNGVYRVGGGGVAPSSPFVLPRDPGLHLHVRAGSSFWHQTGIGAFVVGGLTMVLGGVVAGSASSQSDAHQTAITGAEIAAPGLAVLALGAILWLTSASVVTTADGRVL